MAGQGDAARQRARAAARLVLARGPGGALAAAVAVATAFLVLFAVTGHGLPSWLGGPVLACGFVCVGAIFAALERHMRGEGARAPGSRREDG